MQESLTKTDKEPDMAGTNGLHCNLAEPAVIAKNGGGKKIWFVLLISAVIAFAAIVGYPFAMNLLSYIETDNAYITGHIHTVGARIAGTVGSVVVNDNQLVKTGDLLATLDDRDEIVEVRKAEAHLAKAQKDVSVAKNIVVLASSNAHYADKTASASMVSATHSIAREEHVVRGAEVGISLAKQLLVQREAELRKTELDLHRYTALEKAGAVATENLDTVRRDYDVALAAKKSAANALEQAETKMQEARSQLEVAKAQYISAKASGDQAQAANQQIGVNTKQKISQESSVQEALVDLDNAKLKLSYTRILAPITGRIGRKTVEVGQRVQTGSPLMAIVSDEKWVVANYKETQLRDIRIGQEVKFTVDALGDHEFTGRVDSFSPASGAAFALLPPDNATGNFTKIVQRVPVKIILDANTPESYKERMTPGMSCFVKVKVH
ncbi:MAG: HlyD family secretion protein [Cyanobacteria bacterium SZAS LIN-2]|nr:HlyD family secretion protein [Cyanobacteria bacterium SZAS LIN-3]MBS1996841.1 HlyD family secretion protein [Cyanobacteria bacterium SZAS LIN-2]